MARPFGVELGAIYTITGPDGSRAVFNDPTSPDFAGYIVGEDGVSGLERGGVRENADVLPEGDGGVHGVFRRDRLPFTLKGIVAQDDGAGIVYQDRILRATQALAGDALLEFTSSSIPEGLRLSFREQQPTRITGRRPKQFLIAGVAEDPLIYSQAAKNAGILPAAAGAGGFTSPLTSPLTTVAAVNGQAYVLNDGSGKVWPTYVVVGPCTNPIITNATTGKALRLLFTLAAGEVLVIDTNPRRRCVKYGVATITPVNLLPNPSFEVNATGAAAGAFNTVAVVADATFGSGSNVLEQAIATAATNAASYVGIGPAAVGTAGVPCTPGQTISMTAMAKIVSTNVALSFLYLNARYFDAAGAFIASNQVGYAIAPAVGEVRTLAGTDTAPVGAAFVCAEIWSIAPTGYNAVIHWDDLAIGTTTYVDGDTPGYGWAGTPHASSSGPRSLPTLASRYSALDFTTSQWPELLAGLNDLRIGFDSYSLGARLEVQYRDAWG